MSTEKLTEDEREAVRRGTCQASGPKALRIVHQQTALLRALLVHLDYCGWGDSWERECSEELRKTAEQWLKENGS